MAIVIDRHEAEQIEVEARVHIGVIEHKFCEPVVDDEYFFGGVGEIAELENGANITLVFFWAKHCKTVP